MGPYGRARVFPDRGRVAGPHTHHGCQPLARTPLATQPRHRHGGSCFLRYLPALACTYVWDDNNYVTENATLREWDGLRAIWFEPAATPQYYPLVHTTFWIEYRMWGLDPMGYHAVNVLLHAMNALLLWRSADQARCPGGVVRGHGLCPAPDPGRVGGLDHGT